MRKKLIALLAVLSLSCGYTYSMEKITQKEIKRVSSFLKNLVYSPSELDYKEGFYYTPKKLVGGKPVTPSIYYNMPESQKKCKKTTLKKYIEVPGFFKENQKIFNDLKKELELEEKEEREKNNVFSYLSSSWKKPPTSTPKALFLLKEIVDIFSTVLKKVEDKQISTDDYYI